MQKYRFLSTNTIHEAIASRVGNRISVKFVGTEPSDLCCGFVELNEFNYAVQGDFSDYKYIYKTEEDGTVIFTVDKDDVYVEPPKPEPEKEPEPHVPTEEELQEEYDRVLRDKIEELSIQCQNAIYSGVQIGDHHYSYTLQDQANLNNAILLAKETGMAAPYHADGESCAMYELSDLMTIYMAQMTNVTTLETKFNQMKLWLQTLTDRKYLELVKSVDLFNTELVGKYLEAYNTIMAQAELLASVVGK